MCGIFGFSVQRDGVSFRDFERSVKLLFSLSEERGRDSAGIIVIADDALYTHKEVVLPSKMLKSPGFLKTLRDGYAASTTRLAIVGHCRLVTNGSFFDNENNHPIEMSELIGTHNGIVLNAEEMEGVAYDQLTREHWRAASDTRLFFKKINELTEASGSLRHGIAEGFRLMEGSASIALVDKRTQHLHLATNAGSLYYAAEDSGDGFTFASERHFVATFLRQGGLLEKRTPVVQLKPGQCAEFDGSDCDVQEMSSIQSAASKRDGARLPSVSVRSDIDTLRRCTACILPETYPFIDFDERGVCNFCRRHQNQQFHGPEALERVLERYRSSDGSPDCLVGLSGGRDSCYGLHALVKEFGMTPITYTYDWGLTTDVSRRNQAKMLGRLGVENILRAAPIQKKRRHIQKNIQAWLKHPKPGMVPLFMAGDKDFYQYGRTLRKQLGLELTIFCTGHLLEQREFFVGFCGVDKSTAGTARTYDYSRLAKMQLAFYYVGQYLRNPAYINESLFDALKSFLVTFLLKDDFLYLFEYLPWDEEKIEALLKEEYGWETSTQYGTNQWRMGDGQTAFTNYIWHTIAGFTEFDNFRSNQVREGLLTRDEALRLAGEDNRPKMEALEYFAYLVGFNLDDVLAQINAIPKMY